MTKSSNQGVPALILYRKPNIRTTLRRINVTSLRWLPILVPVWKLAQRSAIKLIVIQSSCPFSKLQKIGSHAANDPAGLGLTLPSWILPTTDEYVCPPSVEDRFARYRPQVKSSHLQNPDLPPWRPLALRSPKRSQPQELIVVWMESQSSRPTHRERCSVRYGVLWENGHGTNATLYLLVVLTEKRRSTIKRTNSS